MKNQNPSLLTLDAFKSLLSPRPRDAQKGLFGHVLLAGGYTGMVGAVCLAGEAALRTGAGLVSVMTLPEHVAVIANRSPEIMVYGLKNNKDIKNLNSLFIKSTVIVIGPGLGQTKWSKQLFEKIISLPHPKIIDADGLNLLAQYPQKSEKWILTPHPGEAARLLHCTTEDIQADRINSVSQLQAAYGGVVILKGAGSLICTPNTLSLCRAGNPGMASGGMGDVLSGVIGSLVAQRVTLQQAAELGVCLHASAGDLAAQQLGERGLVASDLMPYLHKLVNP